MLSSVAAETRAACPPGYCYHWLACFGPIVLFAHWACSTFQFSPSPNGWACLSQMFNFYNFINLQHLPTCGKSGAFPFGRLTCVLSALPTTPWSNRLRNRLPSPASALSGRLQRQLGFDSSYNGPLLQFWKMDPPLLGWCRTRWQFCSSRSAQGICGLWWWQFGSSRSAWECLVQLCVCQVFGWKLLGGSAARREGESLWLSKSLRRFAVVLRKL